MQERHVVLNSRYRINFHDFYTYFGANPLWNASSFIGKIANVAFNYIKFLFSLDDRRRKRMSMVKDCSF